MSSKADAAASWMEKTAEDPLHGYDQIKRWGPDYDCSSAVITAYENAGVPVKEAGAGYTGNMLSSFKKCGFKDVTKLVNLKTGAGLQRGDVLLNPRHHTAMFVGNGQLAEAAINEKGGTHGGKTGDQTGHEFHVRSYYNFPWQNALRYTKIDGSANLHAVAKQVIIGKYGNGEERKKKLQEAGYSPAEVQTLVNELLNKNKEGKTESNLHAVALDAIAGKYGNGAFRRQRLKQAGYNYAEVQAEVNRILKSGN